MGRETFRAESGSETLWLRRWYVGSSMASRMLCRTWRFSSLSHFRNRIHGSCSVMSNGAKAGCVSSQSMVPNCLGNGLLYNVTICLLSSMLEFRRLVPLTVSSLSCVGLIHIVVCRDASGCFVVYLGLKTAHIPMEAPTEIGASIREKGRSGKYWLFIQSES